MKWLVAIALVGCTARTQPPAADAFYGSPEQCEPAFDASVVRTCTVASDCVLIEHPNCCGVVEIGVAGSDASAAEQAEAAFDACIDPTCGARGCAAATESEDGKVPSSGQTIVPTCVAGQCSSTVQ